MSELYPSDAQMNALSGAADAEQEVLYLTIGESPYYTSFYKMLYRLLDVARRAGDLRVYKDDDLTFGVRAGKYMDGATVRDYAGATGQSLTNNATNYVYLTAAGTLTVNTTGFPAAGTTPHIPLAAIVTASGTYDHSDITDYRGRGLYSCTTVMTPADQNTLSDGSNADSLHVHDTAGLTDGAVTDAKLAGAITRAKLIQENLEPYAVPVTAMRVWDNLASILPATAAADDLGIVDNTFLTGAPTLETSDSKATSVTQYARFQVAIPPEYVDGQTVTLRVNAGMKTTISDGTATLDAECVRQAAPSTDICATAAQSINSLTPADKDFTITPTNVVPGDLLDIRLTIAITDTATGTAVIGKINTIELLLDIQG